MFFGLFGNKTPTAPAVAPTPTNQVAAPVAVKPSGTVIALKSTLLLGVCYLLQQIVSVGVDATPLVALPPLAKLALSITAPILLSYFLKSPAAAK